MADARQKDEGVNQEPTDGIQIRTKKGKEEDYAFHSRLTSFHLRFSGLESSSVFQLRREELRGGGKETLIIFTWGLVWFRDDTEGVGLGKKKVYRKEKA
jgi:hypothetical protein